MKVDKKQAKLNAWNIVYLHVYCPCHFQGVFRIYKTLSYSNYESVVWPTAILSLESIYPYQPYFFVLHILCPKYMFFFQYYLTIKFSLECNSNHNILYCFEGINVLIILPGKHFCQEHA